MIDKFYVYTIDSSYKVSRTYVDLTQVKFLIERHKLTVIRSLTNQTAHIIDNQVVWMDVTDVPAIETKA